MHTHSLQNMQQFFDNFLAPHLEQIDSEVTVVDVGSKDVNGSYRPIFAHPMFRYTGIDLEAGCGVDVVAQDPYHYPLPDGVADVVMCGQMLEHCEFFWRAFEEMLRIAKPGAFVVVIVPSKGFEHRFPIDCYRFLPDSLNALARYGKCKLLTQWLDSDSEWGDLVGVFLKPPNQLMDSEPPIATEAPSRQLGGVHYTEFLAQDVAGRNSLAHLEIGTHNGASLSRINAPSIAVDPGFRLNGDVVGGKPQCLMFQMTSDEFFVRYRPELLLGRRLDTAFLDGMHWFEYLLRDFMHTEKQCHGDSAIYLHDCLPLTVAMTDRNQGSVPQTGPYAHWWTGDVWKLLPILKRFRPDLALDCLNCPPTGLVRITRLDPDNRVLDDNYDEIVAEFSEIQLTEGSLEQHLRDCNIQDSRSLLS